MPTSVLSVCIFKPALSPHLQTGANTFDILTGDGFFHDTWDTARERRGEGVGTFNNFKAAVPGGARIDWILARGPVTTEFTEIITFTRDGQFPSDHFPVVARVRLGASE